MTNKHFQKEENEILNADEQKVRRMLGELRRVEAPGDFDFRLKARIRQADPQKFRPRLFPVLRYAAPLALVLVVLFAVVAVNLYSTDGNSVPVVENPAANPIEKSNPPGPSGPNESLVAESGAPPAVNNQLPIVNPVETSKKDAPPAPKQTEVAVKPKKEESERPRTDNNVVREKDQAQKKAEVILPPGLGGSDSISVKDTLDIFGIKANFSGKQWKVESVGENTQAGNAGVKADDVITAIDGNDLSGETIRSNKPINGNLTVLRQGQKMELKLRAKQP